MNIGFQMQNLHWMFSSLSMVMRRYLVEKHYLLIIDSYSTQRLKHAKNLACV